MSEDKHQEKNQEKNLPRESFEEFCKRVGIKYIKEGKGGIQLGAYPGGNLLPKKPKKTSGG
jgi:hypothetical protein